MTRARVAVAMAGIATALLLQATVIAPGLAPFPISLPAVLVAAVALVDGPAAGMSFGFVIGLVADLGSRHPAGVLALCWLGIGVVCGAVADRRRLRRDAITAGIVCGLASSVASILLAIVHRGGSAADALTGLAPAVVGDTLLAFGVIALVRRMLHSDTLRAPRPVLTELTVGPPRG